MKSEVYPSVHLFKEMEMVMPYPPGVIPIPKQLRSTAFFPGGYGVWCGNSSVEVSSLPSFPFGGIMAVGQDFDCEENYYRTARQPGQNLTKGMWNEFIKIYSQVGSKLEDTFFTNAYMGLRAGSKSTGIFPGSKDFDFKNRCKKFFLKQVDIQRPRLIIALGTKSLPFISELSNDLKCWQGKKKIMEIQSCMQVVEDVRFGISGHKCVVAFLLHPSLRGPNLRHRKYKQYDKNDADIMVFKDALKSAWKIQ
jgi:uracil-DNA glycosylase